MNTSKGYRLFRLYFNDHSNDFERFGNRVHNPVNEKEGSGVQSRHSGPMIRTILAIILVVAILLVASL